MHVLNMYCEKEMRMVEREENEEMEMEMMEMEMELQRRRYERVRRMASGNAVVIFSLSGCCMCHVVKRLLFGLGVGPTVYELDLESGGDEIQAVLFQLLMTTTSNASASGGAVVPVVFVGGKLLGGLEKVMSCHINGTLVPLLKQAGALWL